MDEELTSKVLEVAEAGATQVDVQEILAIRIQDGTYSQESVDYAMSQAFPVQEIPQEEIPSEISGEQLSSAPDLTIATETREPQPFLSSITGEQTEEPALKPEQGQLRTLGIGAKQIGDAIKPASVVEGVYNAVIGLFEDKPEETAPILPEKPKNQYEQNIEAKKKWEEDLFISGVHDAFEAVKAGASEDIIYSEVLRANTRQQNLANFVGGYSEEHKEQLLKESQATNQVVLAELTKQGVKDAVLVEQPMEIGFDPTGNPIVAEAGDITYTNEFGKTAVLEDTFLNNLSMNKYQAAAGISGASVGAAVGAPLGPLGMIAGGVVGGLAGTLIGTAADTLSASYNLKKDLDMQMMLAQMADAGTMELAFSALGTTVSKASMSAMQKVADLGKFLKTKSTNVQGVEQAIKELFKIGDEEAQQLAAKLSVMTKGASEELTATEQKVLGVMTQHKRGPKMMSDVKVASVTGGSGFQKSILERKEDLTALVKKESMEDAGVVIKDSLDSYSQGMKDLYKETLNQANVLAKSDPDAIEYVVPYDELLIEPLLKDIYRGIKDTAKREDFAIFMTELSMLGNKGVNRKAAAKITSLRGGQKAPKQMKLEAAKAQKTKRLEQTETAKQRAEVLNKNIAANNAEILEIQRGKTDLTKEEAKAKILRLRDSTTEMRSTESALTKREATEKATAAVDLDALRYSTDKLEQEAIESTAQGMVPTPDKGIDQLLEINRLVNEAIRNPKWANITKSLDDVVLSAKTRIDKEIKRVSEEYMGDMGDTWYRQWKLVNAEYKNYAELKNNALYKSFMDKSQTPKEVVNSFMEYIRKDDGTYMEVMSKLPSQERGNVEGAVLETILENNTKASAGAEALDFTSIEDELLQFEFKTPAVRKLRRGIAELAELYRNDPDIMAALPITLQDVVGGSSIAATFVGKAKMVVNNRLWRKFHAMWGTSGGRKSALFNMVSDLMDNPLDSKTVNEIMATVGPDEILNSAIRKLQIEFAEFGSSKQFSHVVLKGEPDKGLSDDYDQVSFTPVNESTAGLREKGLERKVHPKRIITEQELSERLGRTVTEEDMTDPVVLKLMKDLKKVGVEYDDKIRLFSRHDLLFRD